MIVSTMRRVSCISFAFLSLVASVAAQERLSDLTTRIKRSVVTVVSQEKGKSESSVGTGFFVLPDFHRNTAPRESVAQFAKRIRQKADSYYDKKDLDIVTRTLKKYPEYQKSVDFSGTLENTAPDIVFKVDTLKPGTFIVTNWHVIKSADTVKIKTHDKHVYSVTDIVAVSERSDVALLRTDAPSSAFLPLALSSNYPEQGDDILIIGTPLGVFDGSLSKGIISALRDLPDFGEVLQITAPLSEGNSGSPVLNLNGEVVGVATFEITKGQNLNFAISKRILERVLFPGDPARLYNTRLFSN